MRKSRQQLLIRTIGYIIVTGIGVIILIPFFWMISSSLKPLDEIFNWPPKWIPNPPIWQNYINAWNALPFSRFFINTIFVTALGMFAEITSATLVAYGFARFYFPGRDILFLLLLSTMMLPYHVTIIPTYIIWKTLNLINTFDPLVLGAWTAWGPFYVFLFRQFLMTIPLELDDAATIDGANYLQIFTKVMVPLIKPAILAVAVFAFRGYWNNFLGPLLYLNEMPKYTLTLGMYFFMGGPNEPPKWHWLMAMSTVVSIPILIVFFLAQRYFIEGVTFSGLKG